MTGWLLTAAELRIPWESAIAAHRMIVIARDGQAMRQINGLASWFDASQARWRSKPIGYLPSDRLRGYDTADHPETWLPINGVRPGSFDLSAALASGAVRTLADGLSEEELGALLAPGLAAMRRINALSPGRHGGGGLPYPFLGLGPNSNSFCATVLAAMGFAPPRFARPALMAPGARSLLLSEHAIAELRHHALTGQDDGISGARKSAIGPAIASTPSAVGCTPSC